MTPSATPLVTPAAVARLKDAGLHRLAVSLDGATAETHDAFRKVAGSYARTLAIIADAHRVGLPVQINTTVVRHNLHEFDEIAEVVATLGAVLWSVFFLVPTGRATADLRLSADECEVVFEKIWNYGRRREVVTKTTEAPHYRRFVLQQVKQLRATGDTGGEPPMFRRGVPPGQIGTNDGKGVMFIGHTGEIFPSGFLPIRCSQFPLDSVVRVYQESALFRGLRDADRLGGKCGVCEYKGICGGSRARSFALTGDPLAAEPDCAYIPPRYAKESQTCSA